MNTTAYDTRARVRGFYARQSLRPEKMVEIMSDLSAVETPPHHRRFGGWRQAGLLAAALALMGFVGWAWLSADSLDRVVAREIALNHVKGLKPDYPANGFGDLSGMTDKLGFTPFAPDALAGQGFELVGARYCSVQDCMAVQLRLTDRDNRAWTLYQVRPNAELAELESTEVAVDGVRVRLWKESGLVMGLAHNQ